MKRFSSKNISKKSAVVSLLLVALIVAPALAVFTKYEALSTSGTNDMFFAAVQNNAQHPDVAYIMEWTGSGTDYEEDWGSVHHNSMCFIGCQGENLNTGTNQTLKAVYEVWDDDYDYWVSLGYHLQSTSTSGRWPDPDFTSDHECSQGFYPEDYGYTLNEEMVCCVTYYRDSGAGYVWQDSRTVHVYIDSF